MRILRVGERGAEVMVATLDGRMAVALRDDPFDPLPRLAELQAARDVLDGSFGGDLIEIAAMRIGPSIKPPGKVVAVGLNYRAHAAEAGMAIPDEPILFIKTADTMSGPFDDVCIPPGSQKTDYEVELAVVLGSTVRRLQSVDSALEHVFGYAIADDVSERAFQLERGGQWGKGKNCDTFLPFGPYLVTADEVSDPQRLQLSLTVDGEVRQDSSTADMIFPVSHLLWYISQFTTLRRGDVVLTGTPQGVGSGFEPPRFLRSGQVVEASIDGLGTQRHRFVDALSDDGIRRLQETGAPA